MTGRGALFLDKDGVINVDHGYVCTPERTDFIDSIFDLCRASTRNGFLNVVATNQAGIARGHYSESQFLAYMDWVRGEFRKRDAQLDAVYYCPHHPVHGIGEYLRDCACRKPKPGMFLAAQRDLVLDLDGSILVGDSGSDVEAGKAAGVGTCLRVTAILDQGTMRPAFDAGTLQRLLTLLQRNDAQSADT
ncbi:MAG: D-glycero-alpha-D-manno-heptose-1,7-bisphosphate 7-phosphatase [Rhodanobacteraceae bacterium]